MPLVFAKARPLLGTIVSIQIRATKRDMQQVERAMADAFSVIHHIGQVMNAHHCDSDLARMARAQANDVLTLDRETVHVIRASQTWVKLTQGAFNPCLAAHALSHTGHRPGLVCSAQGTLDDIQIQTDTCVEMTQAVGLDFGGIAKGYAVDRAIETLQAHGIRDALVNAGGDLRALGMRPWPIEVRHAKGTLMDARLGPTRHLRQKAIATSVSGALNPEFVMTRQRIKPLWRSVTIEANNCMTADVLTKWAMQSTLLCPELRAVLRQNHGRMWRTR